MLEFFPALARLPAWLPGGGFLRYLEQARQGTQKLRDTPWFSAREAIVSPYTLYQPLICSVTHRRISPIVSYQSAGRGQASIVHAMLEQFNHQDINETTQEEEEMARNVAGAVYIGMVGGLYVSTTS